MGFSPLKAKKLIRFDELARTLSGLELYPAPTHEELEFHWQCEDAIRDAILDGSLQAVGEIQIEGSNAIDLEYMPPITLHDFDPQRDKLIAKFKRQDIYTWLKESGHSDSDIPDALKEATVKTKQAPSERFPRDQPINHRRKETYLKLIEALVLEALGEIPKEPYKTAGRLEVILESHGLTLNKEPIAETIREIQKAREERDP
ncbi:hypothetical protein [Halomonas sp.]|uniref:hypothetical protein n=1 Tax=Halomonas sp. TaxID=1486246 RepID=UPI003A94976E